jgi:hypothetical protein
MRWAESTRENGAWGGLRCVHWLAVMWRERRLGGSATGENPIQGFVQIAKDFDSGVTGGLAEDFEHASEAEGGVIGNQDGAAGSGQKDGTLRELADVVAGEFGLGDVSKVQELRERRVEVGIVEEFILEGEEIGNGEGAGTTAHDQTILPVNLIESRHRGMTCLS